MEKILVVIKNIFCTTKIKVFRGIYSLNQDIKNLKIKNYCVLELKIIKHL